MAKQQSIIEIFVKGIVEILSPLSVDIAVGNEKIFLKEALGIAVDSAQEAAFRQGISGLRNSIDNFIETSEELYSNLDDSNATEAENIIILIEQLLENVIAVINDFDLIITTLQSFNLPITYNYSEIPRNLFNYLLYRYFDNFNGLNAILQFLNIYTPSPIHPNPHEFVKHSFDPYRIVDWLGNGKEEVSKLFNWDNPEQAILKRLETLLSQLNVFSSYTSNPPSLDIFGGSIVLSPDLTSSGLNIIINVNGVSETQIISNSDWKSTFQSDLHIPAGTQLHIDDNFNINAKLPSTPSGIITESLANKSISFEWKLNPQTNNNLPYLIFGEAGKSRLEIKGFYVKVGAEFSTTGTENLFHSGVLIEAGIEGGNLIIDTSSSEDGFLKSILPEHAEAKFDLKIGFSAKRGFYFHGGSALEVKLPMNVSLGIAELLGLDIGVGFKDGNIAIDLGGNLKIELGPVKAIINNIGLTTKLSFPNGGSGNLGPIDLTTGFKFPDGLGITIDGGGFKGTGLLNFEPDKGQYFGQLLLDFKGICSLTAFGILNTKMPNGEAGYSFALIISTKFPTALQIGMGFTLMQVGGMIGLNRAMNVEPLRTGMKEGTLENSLFLSADQINSSRVITDLQRVFPIAESRFVFGPMAKMGWGTPNILNIDLALLIELPDPVKVVLLGLVKTSLPNEENALLKINCAFIGEFNMERKYMYFYASIYDSRLLWFTLSGDMLFLLNWGTDANFVLSLGGFHPKYKAPPLPVPALKRITINLLADNNPRLTIEHYFAITSNSVQFGAKAELSIDAWILNIYGLLQFDTLFQFSPFYFSASIKAMLAVRIANETLFSINLSLTLEGPTPWHASGVASFTIFIFITIDVGFDITWGERQAVLLPLEDVYTKLKKAFEDNKNWKAVLPKHFSQAVLIKESVIDNSYILLHPMGILEISQKTAPLNLEIKKFGYARPTAVSKFNIPKLIIGTTTLVQANNFSYIKEQFALGQFVDLNEQEALSHPSFDLMDSGISLDLSNKLKLAPSSVKKTLEYEVVYAGENYETTIRTLDESRFNRYLARSASARSPIAKEVNARINFKGTKMLQKEFIITNMDTLQAVDTRKFASVIEGDQALEKMIIQNPSLEGNVQLTSNYHQQSA